MDNKAEIKDWFFSKFAEENNLPRVAIAHPGIILKETEKAAYIMFCIGWKGDTAMRKCSWIPKSAVENYDSLTKETDYEKAVKLFKVEFDM